MGVFVPPKMPAVILELLTTIYKASLNVFDAKDPDA
jgi:hypothetical protein